MFSIIGANIIFGMMEYFSFINLFLLYLFIILGLFFMLINSTLLYYSNINFDHYLMEFISTLFSLLFLIIMISPALIILIDFDLIMIPSIMVYSLGLQWAWQFNIIFLPVNLGYNSYTDHYMLTTHNIKSDCNDWASDRYNMKIKMMSSNKSSSNYYDRFFILANLKYLLYYDDNLFNSLFKWWMQSACNMINKENMINQETMNNKHAINESSDDNQMMMKFPQYLFDLNSYILLPIYSFIRMFVYSFDVIHTLGFYSWGIKMDAIPGSINITTTLSLLWKGEHSGKCSESCGQGHLSMLLISVML